MAHKKVPTPAEALQKMGKYCAYQERSQYQVRNKLYNIGVFGDDAEEIISKLIQNDFINEERFAKAYVSGKFRIKKWGRVKIKAGLSQHRISDFCMKAGLKEIDEEEYLSILKSLIKKKKSQLIKLNSYIREQKVAQFAIRKGFEPGMVWEILNDVK